MSQSNYKFTGNPSIVQYQPRGLDYFTKMPQLKAMVKGAAIENANQMTLSAYGVAPQDMEMAQGMSDKMTKSRESIIDEVMSGDYSLNSVVGGLVKLGNNKKGQDEIMKGFIQNAEERTKYRDNVDAAVARNGDYLWGENAKKISDENWGGSTKEDGSYSFFNGIQAPNRPDIRGEYDRQLTVAMGNLSVEARKYLSQATFTSKDVVDDAGITHTRIVGLYPKGMAQSDIAAIDAANDTFMANLNDEQSDMGKYMAHQDYFDKENKSFKTSLMKDLENQAQNYYRQVGNTYEYSITGGGDNRGSMDNQRPTPYVSTQTDDDFDDIWTSNASVPVKIAKRGINQNTVRTDGSKYAEEYNKSVDEYNNTPNRGGEPKKKIKVIKYPITGRVLNLPEEYSRDESATVTGYDQYQRGVIKDQRDLTGDFFIRGPGEEPADPLDLIKIGDEVPDNLSHVLSLVVYRNALNDKTDKTHQGRAEDFQTLVKDYSAALKEYNDLQIQNGTTDNPAILETPELWVGENYLKGESFVGGYNQTENNTLLKYKERIMKELEYFSNYGTKNDKQKLTFTKYDFDEESINSSNQLDSRNQYNEVHRSEVLNSVANGAVYIFTPGKNGLKLQSSTTEAENGVAKKYTFKGADKEEEEVLDIRDYARAIASEKGLSAPMTIQRGERATDYMDKDWGTNGADDKAFIDKLMDEGIVFQHNGNYIMIENQTESLRQPRAEGLTIFTNSDGETSRRTEDISYSIMNIPRGGMIQIYNKESNVTTFMEDKGKYIHTTDIMYYGETGEDGESKEIRVPTTVSNNATEAKRKYFARQRRQR